MKKNLIFFISITIILLIFFLTRPADEESMIITEPEPAITGHAVYEEIQIEEPQIEEIPIEDPKIEDSQEEQIIQIPKIEAVSKLRCVDDKIELFLANPTNDTLKLVQDIVIHLNGMIVVDPECSRYTIIPGKKVFCSDISGHLPIRKGKKNNLQISMGSEKFDSIVDCGN